MDKIMFKEYYKDKKLFAKSCNRAYQQCEVMAKLAHWKHKYKIDIVYYWSDLEITYFANEDDTKETFQQIWDDLCEVIHLSKIKLTNDGKYFHYSGEYNRLFDIKLSIYKHSAKCHATEVEVTKTETRYDCEY